MAAAFHNFLLIVIRHTLAVAMLLSFTTGAHASETYMPGIYEDSDGNQYLVSGATETTGRNLWTIASTHNSTTYFSAIWETGAAVGNSLLAGSSYITTYSSGYAEGRSYGVLGYNNFPNWDNGEYIAVVQSGKTISISQINYKGETNYQITLTLVSKTAAAETSSEDYISGIFRDRKGYGYLVSGTPSQTDRTLWTIVSLPDNPNEFNGTWETGAAVGNALLAGDSDISNYSSGYAEGRSYGVMGYNDVSNWDNGEYIAVAQVGNTISISQINYKGFTNYQLVLVKDNSSSVSYGTGSEAFSAGYYRSWDGKRYLVSGSNESTGRTLWTIASVSMPTEFNGTWETGAAVGNALLAGDSDISNYSSGYAEGRSYGVMGYNDVSNWDNGEYIAVAQVGNTISISQINYQGFTNYQLVLIKESSTSDETGEDTEGFVAGTDYEDVNGNTYTVENSDEIWTITGTGDKGFNAQWETGAAASNTLLAGSSNITNYPSGYAEGRYYGVVGGDSDFSNWDSGEYIAVAQVADTISISQINYKGFTNYAFMIIKGGEGGVGGAGTIALNSATYYVNKYDSTAVIGVTRTDGGTGAVTATYSTANGTAISGTDYTAASGGTLAWADGNTDIKFINITIPSTATSGRSFTITLTKTVGDAEIGDQSTATVTIIDDITDVYDDDTDDDGMPDIWEVQYELDPFVYDAVDDPDGDGYTNLQEYKEEGNPNSSDSPFPWELFYPAIM